MSIEDIKKNVREATVLLKAMANDKRLKVLCALHEGEKSVGELEKLVGLSQSALSQHLARMRHDGLVTTRRSAQTIYYSLKGQEVQTIMKGLRELYRTPRAKISA